MIVAVKMVEEQNLPSNEASSQQDEILTQIKKYIRKFDEISRADDIEIGLDGKERQT